MNNLYYAILFLFVNCYTFTMQREVGMRHGPDGWHNRPERSQSAPPTLTTHTSDDPPHILRRELGTLVLGRFQSR